MGTKRIPIEHRITDYFATEPLASARTLLAVVTRQVAQRIDAETPQGTTRTRATKKPKHSGGSEPQDDHHQN